MTGESEYVSQQTKLAPEDGDSGDGFGNAVALADDGSMAFVAAKEDEDPNGQGSGSAYVFTCTDEGWSQQTKLAPDDGDVLDGFGGAVALGGGGSAALVGAKLDDDPNGEKAGSAYVFEGPWEQ